MKFPQSQTWGKYWSSPGELERRLECFLLTSFLVLQTVPDGRKSLLRSLWLGLSPRADPQLLHRGKLPEQQGDAPTQAQPILHNNLEI